MISNSILALGFITATSHASAFSESVLGVSRHRQTSNDPIVCSTNGNPQSYTHTIPTINLSTSSSGSLRPNIDGIISPNEYDAFLSLPMYNAGKNAVEGEPSIATSYIAYDCSIQTLCVGTVLNQDFLDANTNAEVWETNAHSWVELDDEVEAFKHSETGINRGRSSSFQFSYVHKENDSTYTIGYEGCWSSATLSENSYIIVHFDITDKDSEGANAKTTATGFAVGSAQSPTGYDICIERARSSDATSYPSKAPTRGGDSPFVSEAPTKVRYTVLFSLLVSEIDGAFMFIYLI